MSGVCEFPTINANVRNVFMSHKKSRPANPPECFLSRNYVASEGLFDFGPLLVGKDAEKRHEDAIRKMNASEFRISNNGKYDLQVQFALHSTLDPTAEKSPFLLEPESMDLRVDQTEMLTVWAFPDKAQSFRDEIVALVRDNPNAYVFNLGCLGAKPIVEVDNEVVEFDRLLLNQSTTRQLTVKNVSAIPVKWNLAGTEGMPEEFEINKTNGMLKPHQEVVVDIKFSAIKQEKLT